MATPCRVGRPLRITTRRNNSRLPSRSGLAIGALPIALRSDKDRCSSDARVAQLVEHMTENHGVGGSIPSPGTICRPPLTSTTARESLWFNTYTFADFRGRDLASGVLEGIFEGFLQNCGKRCPHATHCNRTNAREQREKTTSSATSVASICWNRQMAS
jgi:hypothetical protein